MAKTKEKLPPVERQEYETALKIYVQKHTEFATLAAKRDKRVAAIDAEFDTRLNELKESMSLQRPIVERFCIENKEELFPKIKSKEEFGAKIGFRYDPPAVETLKGFTFKAIAEKFAKLKAWKKYIRITVSLNKEALLADKPKGMDKHGLVIEQEEHFILDVEQTEVNA